MVGVWIPLLAVPNDDKWFWYVIAAFALFRIFDIAKPLGIRRMESLKGGVGVMMDDIVGRKGKGVWIVGFTQDQVSFDCFSWEFLNFCSFFF